MRSRIRPVYERKFETDAHDGERYYCSPPRDERCYAVYASHRERNDTNDGPMLMIISMVAGAVIGELIDLNRWITVFGDWVKAKTGNTGDPQFTHAFITASLTFTVGAMGVLGSIQDGLTGNYQTLLLKGILDGIIVMVMVSSMGKGALFSFIPVGITQWIITAMAHIAAPLMTPSAIDNLSYVGSILIFCVGIDLIWPGKIRIANLLPAIFVAMGLTFLL